MKDIGLIQGSAALAVPLIIGKDTVYVHTNIEKIDVDAEGNPTDNLYQYNEVQYTKDEYIRLLSENNTSLEKEITSTQLALCSVYELLG